MKHIEWLKRAGACASGLRYAARFATLREAWDACERADHMVWLIVSIEEAEAGFDPAWDEHGTEDEYGAYTPEEQKHADFRDQLFDQYGYCGSPDELRDAYVVPDALPELPK